MKSVLFGLVLVLHYTFICDAMNQQKPSIIPGAAYFIIKGTEKVIRPGLIPKNLPEEYATLYTAFGDKIRTISQNECPPSELKNILDPSAPKPKAAFWALKYLPSIPLASRGEKVHTGYFIVLLDKNDNYIASLPYNQETHKLATSYDPLIEIDDILELKNFDMQHCTEKQIDDLIIEPHLQPPACCCMIQ